MDDLIKAQLKIVKDCERSVKAHQEFVKEANEKLEKAEVILKGLKHVKWSLESKK